MTNGSIKNEAAINNGDSNVNRGGAADALNKPEFAAEYNSFMTGAEAIVECLKREGATTVFGYPGAAVLPLYEALRASGVRHVLTGSEQGAGHAANGFARVSGRPGVCLTTSGPGATNLFTAIATAYSDSVPMIAITGQVATYNLGRDVFQEVDTTGAAEPFTKYTYLVKSASDIGRIVKEAFHICSTGRKGPVLIDVPVDIQREAARLHYPDKVDIRGYKPSYSGNALQVKRVAQAIGASKRPLLCLGGGVFLSGAEMSVRNLCERLGIPAVTTLMGIGVLPPGSRFHYGMLGQSGNAAANHALAKADLLVIIGARIGDRAIKEPSGLAGSAIAHIDIDPAEIGKNIGTTIPLVGDAARVLEQLSERELGGEWPEWIVELDEIWKRENEGRINRAPRHSGVDPAIFVSELSRMLPDDAIYVADVGQNQIWSAKNFKSNSRFLTTGGMGTMGYSLPAAIGAKLACPERPTLAVMGDGAFIMSMHELATVKALGIPVKIVVMNNGALGLVREMQTAAGLEPYAVDLQGSPDIGLIAKAFGVDYARVADTDEAVAAVPEMLSHNGSFLLECAIDADERT